MRRLFIFVVLVTLLSGRTALADDPIAANPPVVKVVLNTYATNIPAGVANEAKFGFEQPQYPFPDATSANYAYWAAIPQDPSLPLHSEIVACGFINQPNATLISPDKRQNAVQLESIGGTKNDCWRFTLGWSTGLLLGTYELKVEGNGGKLNYQWNVVYPSYKMAAPLGNGQYFLMGFKPDSDITIRFYALKHDNNGQVVVDTQSGTPIASYASSKTIKADKSGATILVINVPPSAPFALDEVRFMIDGVKATTWDSPKVFAAMSGKLTCPGSPQPRLTVAQTGRTLANVPTNEDYTAVHIAPKNQATIGHIPAGQTFSVTSGPVCAPNFTWWKVQAGDLVGWMIEGKKDKGQDIFWLEPAS
ncbi:MAG: hypothetical protein ABI947_13295 [Chloroflexota bacterium]